MVLRMILKAFRIYLTLVWVKRFFFSKGSYLTIKGSTVLSGTELLGKDDVCGISGSSILVSAKDNDFEIFTSKPNTMSDVIFKNIITVGFKYGISIPVKGCYFTKVKWYNCVFSSMKAVLILQVQIQKGMYANMVRNSYSRASNLAVFC